MDDALKKRLVGAVILVSLVVIFVPMLVEDKPAVSPQITETNIPPRPSSPAPAEDGGDASATSDDAEAEPSPPAISLPLPPAESAVPPQGATTRPPPQAGPEPAGNASPSASSASRAPPSRPSGWVVQVASFSDKGNADQTLARLREAGYDSFLEEIRIKDKALYRVRVGPEVERAQAQTLQGRIAAELKLHGQVLRYP